MIRAAAVAICFLALCASCTMTADGSAGTTLRHRFREPPEKAARCFARNAEEHSSALKAEVEPRDARGNVRAVVRVTNGVLYATADIRPAGAGSDGTIVLMVVSSGGREELARSLLQGC